MLSFRCGLLRSDAATCAANFG